MREIKFRAWDKINSRMSEPFHIWNVESDGGYGDTYNSKIDAGFEITAYELEDNKLYELLQFTGLKDKNGIDIYEGDIIEYEEIQRDGSIYPNHDRRAVKWLSGHYNTISLNLRLWKIIGNIYENIELLTK